MKNSGEIDPQETKTVGELIEKLKEFNPESRWWGYDDETILIELIVYKSALDEVK